MMTEPTGITVDEALLTELVTVIDEFLAASEKLANTPPRGDYHVHAVAQRNQTIRAFSSLVLPEVVRALVAEVRVARESRRVLAEVLAAVRCQPKGTPHRMINDYVPEGCDTDCPFEGREADCFEKTANRIARVILGLPPKEAPDD
jgi:hypothetical protein